jgi:hypothetical protein
MYALSYRSTFLRGAVFEQFDKKVETYTLLLRCYILRFPSHFLQYSSPTLFFLQARPIHRVNKAGLSIFE